MTVELTEGLQTRKTIRGFLEKEVPRDVVRQILTDAHCAPSASNQQPWNFYAVTGEPLAGLCASILAAHNQKKKAYDPSRGKTIPPPYVERTKKLFKELRPLLSSLGDESRSFIENGSYRFYGAPVVVFVTMHQNLPTSRLMDIGMAVENLLLSAHARGLGTCAIALTLLYADIIREELKIPDDFDILLSIALGYPDENFIINNFRSSREALDACITWVGFER